LELAKHLAARNELTSFLKASGRSRPAVIVAFIVFVAMGFAEPIFVLFGAIDMLGAVWTGLALRSSEQSV